MFCSCIVSLCRMAPKMTLHVWPTDSTMFLLQTSHSVTVPICPNSNKHQELGLRLVYLLHAELGIANRGKVTSGECNNWNKQSLPTNQQTHRGCPQEDSCESGTSSFPLSLSILAFLSSTLYIKMPALEQGAAWSLPLERGLQPLASTNAVPPSLRDNKTLIQVP